MDGFSRAAWGPMFLWRCRMRAFLSLPSIDEGRTRRTVELLTIVWVLGLSDLFFTIWAHRFTAFKELNPIASMLLQHHFVASLAVFKVLLTAMGTAIFWFLRKHTRSEIALWAVMFVYVALMVRWSDYTSQVLMMGMMTP
jgi:hypothetical protein